MPFRNSSNPHRNPRGGSSHRQAWRLLVVVAALVATGCTGNSTDPSSPPTPATAQPTATAADPSSNRSPDPSATSGDTGPASLPAAAPDRELVAGANAQDLWLFADVRVVDERGLETSVLDDVVAEISPTTGTAIDLAGVARISPVPGLQVRVVAGDGAVRDHVRAQVVLWEPVAPDERPAGSSQLMAEGKALGIVTTAPPDTVNVSVGDRVQIHPDQLDATAGAETLAVDYVFGQALPGDDETIDDSDDLALLAARWEAGSVQWMGQDGQPMVRVGVIGSRRLPAGNTSARDISGSETPGRGTPGTGTADPTPSGGEDHGSGAGSVQAQPAGYWGPQAAPTAAERGLTATTVRDPGTILGPPLGLPIKEGMIGWGAVAFTAFCITAAVVLTGGSGVVFTVVCVSIDAVTTVASILDTIADNDNPPGCQPGQTCGSSGNDPHLNTFDDVAFDAHAQGEVVLARDQGMQVQARMAPVPGSSWAANNTAVALEVEGDVVVLDRQAEAAFPHHALVNGQPQALGDPDQVELPGGGSLTRSGAGVITTWPDGSSVTATLTRGHVNVFVLVAGEREERVVGLLGDADGDSADEPFTADGDVFAEPSPQDLSMVVDSWRVTDADSLFPGGLTHDDAFPSQAPNLDDLPADRVSLAQSVCAGRGLAGVDLANCTMDVAVTGDPVLANAAAEQQGLHRPDAFVSPPGPSLVGPRPDDDALATARSSCLEGGVYREAELDQCREAVARTDDASLVPAFAASQFQPTASLDDACLAALGIEDVPEPRDTNDPTEATNTNDAAQRTAAPDSRQWRVADGPTPTGTIAWRMSDETDVDVDDFGAAVGDEDRVVAAGAALRAHDAGNGALLWNVAATGNQQEPVMASDVVITTSETGHTLHLASTGEPCGTVQIAPDGEKLDLAAPMLTDGWLVTWARFGVRAVVGVDLATGESWVHPEDVTYLWAAAADATVAIGAGPNARGLDLSTGKPRWTERLKFLVEPVEIAGGTVLANDLNLALQARDPATGELRWQADHESSSWGDRVAANDQVVVTAGSGDDVVVAADLATGDQRWAVQLPGRPHNLVVVGDSAWVTVGDTLVGLSLQDGSQLASLDLAADAIAALPGALAVSTSDGDVVVVR